VLDGAAVLDKETGLVWEKSPDTTNSTWVDAITYCYNKNVGGRKGWRLPTVPELASLVDPTQSSPALPSGHPFQNVQAGIYWSSTETADPPGNAWYVGMYGGGTGWSPTSGGFVHDVWAVRGGK